MHVLIVVAIVFKLPHRPPCQVRSALLPLSNLPLELVATAAVVVLAAIIILVRAMGAVGVAEVVGAVAAAEAVSHMSTGRAVSYKAVAKSKIYPIWQE